MTDVKYIIGERNKRPLKLSGSVALVGNSDKLLNSGIGAEIDSFEHVFRFNLCDLKPDYHKDVGKKVDYCFFSLNISTHKFPHKPEEYTRFVKLCRTAAIICYPGNTSNVRKFNRKPLLMAMPFEKINPTFINLVGSHAPLFNKSNHPRNGIKLLACLLDAGLQPTLFGFDLEKRSANKHYFDNEIQREPEGAGHRPSWEYELLSALADKNFINVRM